MKARVVSVIALAMGLLVASRFAGAAPSLPDIPGHAPKLTIYLAKGAANSCGQGCDHWIAVEGRVDRAAAARVRQFLSRVKGNELPFYFHSPGGDVRQALAIGRMLRGRKATGRVGRTVVGACPAAQQVDDACLKIKGGGGEIEASVVSRGAMCNSACGYLFLGPTTREVAPDALLGVHSSKITLVFRGKPTPRQHAEAMANSRNRSNEEASSFIEAMGISHELVDLIKTVAFESSHVLTRQELYRFGIDKRDFVESNWTMELKSRPFVRKFAWTKKGDGTFRAMDWRLFCEGKDRARLMFIREFEKGAGTSTVAMVAGPETPLKFGTYPARQGVYEIWSAVLKSDEVKALFAQPRLEVGENTLTSDGKATQALFEIDTRGLEVGWTQLSAVCAARVALPAGPARPTELSVPPIAPSP